MPNNKKKLLLSISSIVIFLLVGAIALRAYTLFQSTVADRNDFIVEPAKQEVNINPGESATRSISITSRVKSPITFALTSEDIIGSNQIDQPVILLGGDKSPYSLKDYLHPEIKQFTLNFGQRIQIPVTIELPKTAAPGGFYAAMIVSNAPSKLGATTTGAAEAPGATIISRIASLFFVRVNGPVTQSGHLSDFRVKEKGPVYQNANLTFQIYFNNDGNVHLVPYGYITVKNMWGATVDQLPVDAYFALPHSLRYREIPWGRTAAFGRYTAEVSLNRGYGSTTDVLKISIWVIPWKWIAIVLLILLIIVSASYFLRKNFEFKRKR